MGKTPSKGSTTSNNRKPLPNKRNQPEQLCRQNRQRPAVKSGSGGLRINQCPGVTAGLLAQNEPVPPAGFGRIKRLVGP